MGDLQDKPRPIEYVACSADPHGRWVAPQAHNLVMQFGDGQRFRFLIDLS